MVGTLRTRMPWMLEQLGKVKAKAKARAVRARTTRANVKIREPAAVPARAKPSSKAIAGIELRQMGS